MKLKEMRIKNGLTQEELAAKLDVGQSSVALWETGKNFPTVKKLIQIAEIFECTLDDLIDKEIKST